MKRDILGLVLAGGASRRLGQDKASLSFHGELTQLDYALTLLDSFCSKIAISCREDQRIVRKNSFEAQFVADVDGVKGPMSGIIAGLRAAQGWPVLVLACDMPLVDASFVLRLLSQRDAEKQASCFTGLDGRPEPLLAVYEASSLKMLEKLSRQGIFSLRHFLENSEIELIPFHRPQLLASVNTLEDLSRVKEQLMKESV